jgi:3-deoxy-D-manno-octulosonic-acid transferase
MNSPGDQKKHFGYPNFLISAWVIFFRFALRVGRLFFPRIEKLLAVRENLGAEFARKSVGADLPTDQSVRITRIWLHAASQGELEGLLPILTRLEKTNKPKFQIILTVFSPSPLENARRLPIQFPGLDFIFVGPSPLEGEWETALQSLSPEIFVTYKYEAWPELWASLGKLRISTAVIAAIPRLSLKIISWAGRLKLIEIPEIHLFCLTENAVNVFRFWFPNAKTLRVLNDFRWDRVSDISKLTTPQKLLEIDASVRESTSHQLPREGLGAFGESRPRVVLGSVYLEDLKTLFPREDQCLGSLREILFKIPPTEIFVFPHRLDDENLRVIENFLVETQKSIKTIQFHLVKRPGILASFYSQGDVAWVGGGYSNGIHSTIQAAFSGVPIFCGPKNVEKFLETEFLTRTKQLVVCRDAEDILHFWSRISEWNLKGEKQKRNDHQAKIHAQTGGADQFMEWLEKR